MELETSGTALALTHEHPFERSHRETSQPETAYHSAATRLRFARGRRSTPRLPHVASARPCRSARRVSPSRGNGPLLPVAAAWIWTCSSFRAHRQFGEASSPLLSGLSFDFPFFPLGGPSHPGFGCPSCVAIQCVCTRLRREIQCASAIDFKSLHARGIMQVVL